MSQIGTAFLAAASMIINAFTAALLVGMVLPGSVIAATIPVTTNGSPFIEGHNAYSRFLAGAYKPGEQLSDDGFSKAEPSSSTNRADTQLVPDRKAMPSLFALPQAQVPSDSSASDSFDETSDVTSDGEERPTQGLSGVSGGGTTPSRSLSAVPLPASAPLFGVALLILGGLGYGLRGRTSRRA